MADPPALVIAGPTCSGKSALALHLAERLGGSVINADSMQVYSDLRILTARPTPAETARVPHALYGVRPADDISTVAWWRDAALNAMRQAHEAGRLPILCGGTGMYLSALTTGLAHIPDPGAAARAEARQLLAEIGAAGLHARLSEVDPATAARLLAADPQRIARAWEVWRGTGQGLAAWHAQPSQANLAWCFAAIVLDPPRAMLREAIARRFTDMLSDGALDEVRGLVARGLDPALPAMRAHGVPQLAGYLSGAATLAQATIAACVATVRYSKRQATWFRHHKLAEPTHTHTIHAQYADPVQLSESLEPSLFTFICNRG